MGKLSDDTRELLQPSQTWSVFEYSLDNTYLVDTGIKLKRQDVTMREFPWNTNNIPQRLVSVHGADVARRPRKTISLGRDSACPHHVPRGKCALLLEIEQSNVADSILIDHKSIFSLIAEIGGIFSLVTAIGRASIGKFNRWAFRKRFINTYGSAWASKMSQMERDTAS